jgi:hypothetical protein
MDWGKPAVGRIPRQHAPDSIEYPGGYGFCLPRARWAA